MTQVVDLSVAWTCSFIEMSLFAMLCGFLVISYKKIFITLAKMGFHSSDNYFVVKYGKRRIKVSLVVAL